MKLALSLIVKNEEEHLAECLASVKDVVDDIFIVDTGSTDKTVEIAKSFGAKVEEVGDRFLKPLIDGGKPIFWFDEARNYAFSLIPKEYDYILWLDADDVLLHSENIPDVVQRAKETGATSVFFNYIYQAELEGHTIKHRIIEHQRERIIKNDGTYKWESHIHETLIPQKQPVINIKDDRCEVLHLVNQDELQKNIKRNLEILEQQYKAEEGKDPRTTYNLAKAYFDLRDDNAKKYLPLAKEKLLDYLHGEYPSGWAEERCQAYEYLAEIYRINGRHVKSIEMLLMALWEYPGFPETYVNIGMSYLLMQDWDKAMHWVKLAAGVERGDTTTIHNEKQLEQRALEIIYHSALNRSMLDEAWSAAIKLQNYVPVGDEEVSKRVALTTELIRERELTKSFVETGKYLQQTGDIARLRALVSSIPPTIADNPILTNMRKSIMPPNKWGKNDIAIYCGPGWEVWGPSSLEGGIGGSEEAVINLSRELVGLGWKVTVYADPGADHGEHDGVTYLNHYEFNIEDEFNILIGWRNVTLFDYPIKSKRTYLWLHDIPNQADFTEERVKCIDKIFVLSKWHRERLPKVADDKFYITRNGVDYGLIQSAAKTLSVERNPHRLVYTSSYDRGLEHLLQMWPNIREKVSDAELHVFYGWKLFDQFYKDNPERMAWKDKMDRLMRQDGIVHHGRVGQKEVYEEMEKSAIWAYPTHFGEISCITAMKAQLSGAIPVVINFAALKETVRYGVKVDGDIYDPDVQDAYVHELTSLLLDTKRQESERSEMVKETHKKGVFSWGELAKDWTKLFHEA